MPSGKIIKWMTDRGFGFIQEDGAREKGGDFVHITSMPDHDAPRIGRALAEPIRSMGLGDGWSKAVNVREVTTWGEAAYYL